MPYSSFPPTEPTLPSRDEIRLAKESSRSLATVWQNVEGSLKVQIQDLGIDVELPQSSVRLLIDVLMHMAAGNAVTLVPVHAELTTQEAADLLNVSRKFLIDELLDKNVLPCRKVGTHRRIPFQDLMEYKERNRAKRRETIDAMVELDQKLGLY
ncbi:MAG: helix-turn-helix domain-containing protein [Stigonema ocellatum SAG 48.90 = DSM 106950]|nr:helix-turn-helix domain-containing protein [Stigonema ocellatum SAG 48.90 = DSM 106950]